MARHQPPVPPAGRSDKGPGGDAQADIRGKGKGADGPPENLAEQDRQGNTRQNTTNQGYQQDR
ncbi:MAG: hypothetical protein ACM31L_02620 [Actinomycetota bacterium]